ncbi:hypothetical protein P9K31_08005 [Corynebacterium glutamicum]|uniref:hypothetical protein n=1 Tax=Corynebacterium TaxID=1716 RepID=UPI0008064350|nr:MULTISPECIES: hypothetical protein [Corynebacterium]PST75725.1 hypothetical protein I919_07111 [Corynebacterium glutamicum ZL-2]WFP70432.1 hypothetical protein P9K31_08005 [Corynebacterium glutamicum]BAV23122.1 hypothetical protein CGBL_0113930 [Corynebacterium glutamicum]BCB32035.1 hypothetical protein KaCgl_00090 [Corynebacterium glutamicum]BCB35092.1 hypothetical protein KaCgl_30660 [Corynebacterium glutamicum]
MTPDNTEGKLREAMDRLLTGKPRNCDGKLTKANLAREAEVSQATMYRAKNILAEWDGQVSDSTPRNAQASRLEAELAKSRKRARNLEQQNADLRRQVTAAATVIAELSARLEQPLSSSVTALKTRRKGIINS